MNVEVQTHPSGIPIYTVVSGDDTYEISSFGAQLLGWTRSGVPILFANREHAIVDGKTAYRGGAPLCFPYFSKGLLLPNGTLVEPQHGRARNTIWDVEVGENALHFRIEQPSADGYGPTHFRCELTYVFGGSLDIQATIVNVGEQPAPFQFVVHSYWAADAPAETQVEGLGAPYLDNLASYAERTDENPDLPHSPPFDRVYPHSDDRLTVTTNRYRLKIDVEGGSGTVLWNPSPEHSLRDLGTPDFVCVESGIVVPACLLAPQEEKKVRIVYHADLASA